MTHGVVVACVWAGIVCTAAWPLPQAWILLRREAVGAVSPTTWVLAVITTAMAASALVDLLQPWPQIVAALIGLAGSLAALGAGSRRGWSGSYPLVAVLGIGVAITDAVPPAAVLPWLSLLVPIPQLWRAYRTCSSAGISLLTWLLLAGQAVFWAVPIAHSHGDWWLSLPDLIVCGALVVLLVWLGRRRTAASPTSTA